MISCEAPLPTPEHIQFSPPFLVRHVLKHPLISPACLLDSLRYPNVLLVPGSPKRDAVFHMQPHKRQAEGSNNLPGRASCAAANSAQDVFGFLHSNVRLLTQVQLVLSHPLVLLYDPAF